MSKTLWHTMTIKVPSEMVEITKAGKVSIKKTLTKMNNISRSQGYPSIKLVSSSDNKPHIITDGKEWKIEQLKTTLKKSNELAKKNKGRDILTNNSHSMINKFRSNVKSHSQNLVRSKKINNNLIRDLENELDGLRQDYIQETFTLNNRLSSSKLKSSEATRKKYNNIKLQLQSLSNKTYDELPVYSDMKKQEMKQLKQMKQQDRNMNTEDGIEYDFSSAKLNKRSKPQLSFEPSNNNLIRDLENELNGLKRQYSEVITTISIGKPTRELIDLGLRTKEQHSTILNQLKTLTNKVYDKLPRYNFF